MQGKQLGEERLLLDYWEIRALLYREADLLNERDIKYLEQLAAGSQLKQMCDDRSLTSVKGYLKRLRRILGVETNAQAVAVAIRKGLIK